MREKWGRKRERHVGGEEQERVRGEVMEEGALLKYRLVSLLIFNFWTLDTKMVQIIYV